MSDRAANPWMLAFIAIIIAVSVAVAAIQVLVLWLLADLSPTE